MRGWVTIAAQPVRVDATDRLWQAIGRSVQVDRARLAIVARQDAGPGPLLGRKTVIGGGKGRIPNELQPEYLDFGITLVGKGTRIPSGIRIGSNCLVAGRVPNADIPEGGSVLPGRKSV